MFSRLSRLIPQATIALAALVAILPMLVHGPSCGHDFDFHLISWLEASTQFAHGGYPHWAFTPAYNAGEPRFLFYPPISWTLGAVLGLILPWKFVPIAFTWIALTLSGLTMHRLASRYASPAIATVAATLYLANPYMLFTAYERTAYGELLAAAWLPLLFAAILPSKAQAERVRILPVAAAIALLWLTNAPAAVMGSYALAFLTIVRVCTPLVSKTSRPSERSEGPLYLALLPQLKLALTTGAGTALGLCLAAFYLVPAVYEQRFILVNMAVAPGLRPSDHFLFHHMPGTTFDDRYHDAVVRSASLIAVGLLIAIATALLAAWRKSAGAPSPTLLSHEVGTTNPSPLLPLALLTTLIAFLLTPPSLFLWKLLPKLAFLQFPWRLTAILGLIFALAIALLLTRFRALTIPYSLIPLPCLLLAAAGTFPAWHVYAQRCDLEDTIPYLTDLFHSPNGVDPTDEYTAVGADNDALKPGDPPYWLTGDPAAPANSPPGQAPSHLEVDAPRPEYLILNRRAYPAWTIAINGKVLKPVARPLLQKPFGFYIAYDPKTPPRKDGLIVIPLPAGHSTIDLTFSHTLDEELGLAATILASLSAIAIARRRVAPAGN